MTLLSLLHPLISPDYVSWPKVFPSCWSSLPFLKVMLIIALFQSSVICTYFSMTTLLSTVLDPTEHRFIFFKKICFNSRKQTPYFKSLKLLKNCNNTSCFRNLIFLTEKNQNDLTDF